MSRSLPLPRQARRDFLKTSLGALPAVLSPPLFAALPPAALPSVASPAGGPGKLLGFAGIGPSTADELRVPAGYTAQVLLRWGDPVGSPAGMPAFKPNGGNSAAEQALQAGMHCDGMHFFPFQGKSDHGLLVLGIEKNSPMLKQGVRSGCVITTVAGRHVDAVIDLQNVLNDTPSEQCRVETLPSMKDAVVSGQ
jgi:secreted PhoX family phosphatase